MQPYSFIFSNDQYPSDNIYRSAIEYAIKKSTLNKICNPMYLICGYIQKNQFFDWDYITLATPQVIQESINFILEEGETCKYIDNYTFELNVQTLEEENLKYILSLIDCQLISITKKENNQYTIQVNYAKNSINSNRVDKNINRECPKLLKSATIL